MEDYDSEKSNTFLTYFDANNLYGWAMSQSFPVGGFEWIDYNTDYNVSDNSDFGYVLEVELEYRDELHNLHSDFPLYPENICVGNTKETKMVPNLTFGIQGGVQIVNMNNYLQDDRIAAALLEENETSSDDENFVPYSDDESDHISVASEVPSDTDVEEAEINIEPYSDDTASTPQPFYLGKDGRTKWYKLPPRTNVRTRAENLITHLPGCKDAARHKKTHLECFETFFTDEIVDMVLKYTNQKISLRMENSTSNPSYGETNKAELKAVFGLLFLAGLFRSGRQSLIDLWSNDGTGIEVFRNTMTRQRFSFLINNLRFDDLSTRTARVTFDRLAPIRDVFDIFVKNCQTAYTPYEYLTIDEELVAFRGRCAFRQYIPSKPAKYGLKIYALVDAKTFYTMNLEIYCGKQPDNSPYTMSNKPFDVVDRLVRCVSGSGRNITMDNFFMSYETAENLLKNHKLTAVGTLRSNKTCLPLQFKARREEKSSVFGFQKDITIVSYIPKPRKCVHMMSSLHHDDEVDPESGDQRKPSIITFYNSTKSGVDVVDKLARTYDVSRNCKRWPLTVRSFFHLVCRRLNNKIKYIVHYRNLKQCIEMGIKLIKVHRILKTEFLVKEIDLNTSLRTLATSNFEKDFFKLMNNSVFGKTMENIEKRVNVKLLTHWDNRDKVLGAQDWIAKPEFHSLSIFSEH
ncbi:piggyBac transposable element-derived protein 4-like [Colias croceus]|uniref:piggyBac transposable element-derived protein 4-like n=1 Tax=Colias crocea TaxID=72248 RepID=UPI001E27D834|nr:piggyBac transposable element-derived protein 4-like [Colias croceus]